MCKILRQHHAGCSAAPARCLYDGDYGKRLRACASVRPKARITRAALRQQVGAVEFLILA